MCLCVQKYQTHRNIGHITSEILIMQLSTHPAYFLPYYDQLLLQHIDH